MKLVVSYRLSVIGLRKVFLSYCFLFVAFCSLNCNIPNLEKTECSEARQPVKELYSFHFGNDMKPSKENLQLREKFLTGELKQQLEKQTEGAKDYFTATEDYPKAFRIGGCNVIEPNKKLNLQVLLFWKDDNRNEQREVKVEVIKENDKWLINRVEN
jgi:hypothetical protein